MWFLIASTLIVSDPYRGIDYNKINVYDISPTYLEDVIHVHEADTSPLPYNEDDSVEEIEDEDNEEEEAKTWEERVREDKIKKELYERFPYIFPRTYY